MKDLLPEWGQSHADVSQLKFAAQFLPLLISINSHITPVFKTVLQMLKLTRPIYGEMINNQSKQQMKHWILFSVLLSSLWLV